VFKLHANRSSSPSCHTAICALSPNAENSYLTYPSPVPSPSTSASTSTSPAPNTAQQPATGDVLLFSTTTLTLTNIIRAHKSPLSALAISPSGTLLATASDKGTVIRVWSVPGAERLWQFRRGTREARIYSMSFNAVGSLLAVSSAHDTVHIFKLGARQGPGSGSSSSEKKDRPASPMDSVDSRDPDDGRGAGDYDSFVDERKKSSSVSSVLRRRSMHLTKSLSSSVGGYLPNTITEIWEPTRDFAFLRLPTSGARCVVGLSG
jgi:autophagy-related protein 18